MTAAPRTLDYDHGGVIRPTTWAGLTPVSDSAAIPHQRDLVTVADVMTAPPHVSEANAPLDELVHRMLCLGHREIVVTVDGRPMGVVTARSLITLLNPSPHSWPPRYAADLLPPKTPALLPDLHLAQVAAVMTRDDHEVLPVVNSQGSLVGVLTHRDLVDHLAQRASS